MSPNNHRLILRQILYSSNHYAAPSPSVPTPRAANTAGIRAPGRRRTPATRCPPTTRPGTCPPRSTSPRSARRCTTRGSWAVARRNALAGLFQFLLMKLGRPSFVPSRLMIYWGERAIEGTKGQDAGANGDDGMTFLQTKGVCPETTWPYDPTRFAEIPPTHAWAEAAHHKIADPVTIDNTNLDEIRSCLASGYPIAFGFTAYPDLESDKVATTGQLPMPTTGEQPIGGHEVLLVGYDDATELFKVRNSWGPGWGLDGYFLMPYAYATNPDLAGDFRSATVAS